MMELKKKTSKGLFFRNVSTFSQAGIEFLVTIVLAKLLVPADFGIIAIASAFTIFVSRLNEFGLGQALIQKQGALSSKELSTSFWFNLGMGVFFFILVASISPFAQSFFDNMPQLAPTLSLLSTSLVITSLCIVPRTLLEKELEFKKLAYYEFASIVIFALVSILLAYLKFGAYSIVIGRIAQKSGMLFFLYRKRNFMPRAEFDFSAFKSLFNFGGIIVLEEVVTFFYANIDYILIGKILGAISLGYYTMAYQIVTAPNQKIAIAILSVIFPAFCKIQNNNAKMKSGFLLIVKYLSAIIFPILAGYFVVADVFVNAIFGEKWTAAILPSQILVLAGMTKAIGAPISSIFKSKGRPDLSLKFNIGSFLLTTALALNLINYSINGVAFAVMIASIISFLGAQHFCNRLIDLDFGAYFNNLKLSLAASAIMSALVLLLKLALKTYGNLNNYTLLAVLVGAGGAVYLAALYIIDKNIFKEAMEIYAEIKR